MLTKRQKTQAEEVANGRPLNDEFWSAYDAALSMLDVSGRRHMTAGEIAILIVTFTETQPVETDKMMVENLI